MSRPLAIDLYCGLGGFTEGLLAEGYEVIGFDIERHQYGDGQDRQNPPIPQQLHRQNLQAMTKRQIAECAKAYEAIFPMWPRYIYTRHWSLWLEVWAKTNGENHDAEADQLA